MFKKYFDRTLDHGKWILDNYTDKFTDSYIPYYGKLYRSNLKYWANRLYPKNAIKKQGPFKRPYTKYSKKYRTKTTKVVRRQRPIKQSGGRRRRGQIPVKRRHHVARKAAKQTKRR